VDASFQRFGAEESCLGKFFDNCLSSGWHDQEVLFKKIKHLSDEHVHTFKRESTAMMAVRPHTNVIKLYGICCDPGHPLGIVTEHVERVTLKELLQAEKDKITPVQIQNIAKDITRGMKHLHMDKVIHRNLCARNIWVEEGIKGWVCKVAGLSMSRILQHSEFGKTGSDLGPLHFLSPECLIQNSYSTKSDIWAFGCLMVEVLSGGKDPYQDKEPNTIAAQVSAKKLRPQIPPTASPRMKQILESCFEFEPDTRPDFKDILDFLEEAL